MSRNTAWRLFFTVLCIGLSLFVVTRESPQLGLDLEGGTRVVLDLKPREGQQLTDDTAEQTLELLRNRVDSLGVAEPNLQIAGGNRIIIELPGVSDPEEAVRVIGSTAQLSFHSVESVLGSAPPASTPPSVSTAPAPDAATSTSPPTTGAAFGDLDSSQVLGQEAPATSTPETTTTSTTAAPANTPQNINEPLALPDQDGLVLQLAAAALTGEGVSDARAQPPQPGSSDWYIEVDFNQDGASAWTALTGQAACNPSGDPKRQVAIVLDQQVISHPEVDAQDVQCGVGITGNTTIITGGFVEDDARSLALLIRSGALPVDVEVASQQVLGPELGESAIEASRNAVIIGAGLTIIFLLAYYRLLGVIAAISLAAYAVISYAVLIGLNLTLTLPGIAGFVLAIGMAMDSNVLVYERSKEEFASGRTLRSAAKTGFKNALSAIIDSNATTLLAAVVLYFLAIGEVRGFGVTLIVGVLVSVLTTLVVTRTLVEALLSTNWARRHPGPLGMHVGNKFRERLSQNPPNLMGAAKYVLVGSLLVTLLALSGLFIKGINYGIEFSGGRLLEYSTERPSDIDQLREEMDRLGFEDAVVQRTGTDDTTIRVAELNSEQLDQVREAVRSAGGEPELLRDETVGPSFGAELKRKAIIALLIGISTQLLYMAWRFRWTFGIGAVVGMVHDTLLVVGLFAWLGKPFDTVFLASVLTIIAYSINDSVVVFDRIREQRRKRSGESFLRVVNDACAVTLPRTINTGLSALFILGALFFLGGQTLGDFALALLIGISTGIYSSIFVASPIAAKLESWKPAISAKPTTGTRTARAKSAAPAKRSETDSMDDDESAAPAAASTRTSGSTSAKKPAPRSKKPRSKSNKRR